MSTLTSKSNSSHVYTPHLTEDGLEIAINHETGEVGVSQRALARMCGHPDDVKIRRWKGASLLTTLEAEILTESGLQGASLYTEESVFEALAKFNPPLLKKMALAGIRLYLYREAGFDLQPAQPVLNSNNAPMFLRLRDRLAFPVVDLPKQFQLC